MDAADRLDEILEAAPGDPASVPGRASGALELGASREGRPIVGYRFGRGPTRVSLLAGCHADEPVGPRLLRHLAAFLGGLPADDPLLEGREWWIAPHANPDGDVGAVLDGDGHGEGCFDRVGEGDVLMGRDRRPQKRAPGGIDDALNGHRHARHCTILALRPQHQFRDRGNDRLDEFAPTHRLRRHAKIASEDCLPRIVDKTRRKRVERKHDRDDDGGFRIEAERDLWPAAPEFGRVHTLELHKSTLGDQVGGDRGDRRVAEPGRSGDLGTRGPRRAAHGG
jgi:hypothetical protein